jgi:hypothetical protein
MEEVLAKLQRQDAIMRFSVQDDGDVLTVDIWMNGTSYIDEAVRHVRKKVETCAQAMDRPVDVMIAAVIESFEVGRGNSPVHRTYHQSVNKAD